MFGNLVCTNAFDKGLDNNLKGNWMADEFDYI